MPDGSRIVTLIDQLDAALREAGLQRNSFGEKYSIYSFRHFYAVNALRNGVGVFEVARNMGTSVQIIQGVLRQAGYADRVCDQARGLEPGMLFAHTVVLGIFRAQ